MRDQKGSTFRYPRPRLQASSNPAPTRHHLQLTDTLRNCRGRNCCRRGGNCAAAGQKTASIHCTLPWPPRLKPPGSAAGHFIFKPRLSQLFEQPQTPQSAAYAPAAPRYQSSVEIERRSIPSGCPARLAPSVRQQTPNGYSTNGIGADGGKVVNAECPRWVLCHEYRRSKRRWATMREMKEGPSRSAIRC